MPLTNGTRLGPYEVVASLGAGGMGEVYRARDTVLRRDVAIKILPDLWASDPDRLQRFEREAQLLAALNHPHIGAIYGLESAAGQRALVLELVEGPTLADRVMRGPLPIPEALAIARQIADALDAAHEKGIVHRDLKPANIKIAPNGVVKVLDFGLAKLGPGGAGEPGGAGRDELTNSPTLVAGPTGLGTLLGTAPYMSPEQARGLAVDKRTDVWAFGCVLFETLTGRRAFGGATTSDTIAAILEREPEWSRLPVATPPGIRRLLRRCLDKDSTRRLRDAAEARFEIEDALAGPPTDTLASTGRPKSWTTLGWTSALLLSIVATGLIAWNLRPRSVPQTTSTPVTRVSITTAEPLPLDRRGVIALSPDGRHVAYVAGRGGSRRLYVRDLSQFESRMIPGTEGAVSLTFSQDSEWLAFGVQGTIKKVARDGGTPLTLCEPCGQDGTLGLTLSWGTDDAIYLNGLSGIQRVSAAGGAPTVVTTVREGDTGQQFPVLLPEGKGLLFRGNSQMYVQSLETGRRQALGAGVAVDYLPTGHLIYVQAGTVFASPFDPVRLEMTGAPVAVLQGVAQAPSGAAQFSASRAGSIAYVPAGTDTPSMTLVWVDRAGVEQPVGISGVAYALPRLALDGRRLAVVHGGSFNTGGGDVWLHDLTRETSSRVTVGGGGFPAWTSDGRQLAFNKAGLEDVYVRSFDGSGREDRFLTGVSGGSRPMSWSPDGRFLVYVAVNPTTASDIMVVDRQDPTTSRPFLQTRFREGAPIFSPDGHWIAYVSDNSGRNEIYMRPFPGPGEELTISTGGGVEPAWASKTGQLFYRQRDPDAMMSVDVKTTPTLVVGKPRRLFERRYERSDGLFANYDVTPDGRRLLLIKGSAPQEGATQINVVLNWVEELKRLMPAQRLTD